MASINRAQSLPRTIQHGPRRRGGLAMLRVLDDGYENAVPAHGQGRQMLALALEGRRQQFQQILPLRGVPSRSQAPAEVRDPLADCRDAPRYVMLGGEQGTHRFLRGLRRPRAKTTGQGRSGFIGDHAPTHLPGEKGPSARLRQRRVPRGYGTSQ